MLDFGLSRPCSIFKALIVNERQLRSSASCILAMTWITSVETLHHDVKTVKMLMITYKLYHQNKNDFRFYLLWHFENHWGVRAEWISVAARGKRKLTRQTEERIDFDRSQPSFIGTYEGENKGRKRRTREGAASNGATVVQSQQMVWKHISTCMDTHETWYHTQGHITRLVYEQKEGVCVWRQDEAVGVVLPPVW